MMIILFPDLPPLHCSRSLIVVVLLLVEMRRWAFENGHTGVVEWRFLHYTDCCSFRSRMRLAIVNRSNRSHDEPGVTLRLRGWSFCVFGKYGRGGGQLSFDESRDRVPVMATRSHSQQAEYRRKQVCSISVGIINKLSNLLVLSYTSLSQPHHHLPGKKKSFVASMVFPY